MRQAAGSPRKMLRVSRVRVRKIRAFCFLVPTLSLLAVFVYVPLVSMLRSSFTVWDGISPGRYVGMANYRFLAGYEDFHRILFNNVVLVTSGLLVWIGLPFLLSVVILEFRRAHAIRLALFIPALLPAVIVGNIFRLILTSDGPFNASLRSVHLGFLAGNWLLDERLVLVSIIVVIAWAVLGSGVLFYSAGLAAIPQSHVEAAAIDGASWWQVVWNIYRPALRPVTRFWAVLLTISTVAGLFPWIFSLTGGGPGIASTTLDYAVYTTGFGNGQYGLASAIGVVSILFVALVLLLQAGYGRVRNL